METKKEELPARTAYIRYTAQFKGQAPDLGLAESTMKAIFQLAWCAACCRFPAAVTMAGDSVHLELGGNRTGC